MKQYRTIRNARTGHVVLQRARWCANFWCRFRGLQFVMQLPEDQGLLFVTQRESTSDTAIHMLFMFMSIGVIWLDHNGIVVDKRLAKPWRLAYVPQKPAQYFIEARPHVLQSVEIGDKLVFNEATT